MDKVTVGQVYVHTLRFSSVSIIPANLHSRLYLLLLSDGREGLGYLPSKQRRTEKCIQMFGCFKELNFSLIIVFCVMAPCSLVGEFSTFRNPRNPPSPRQVKSSAETSVMS